MDEANTEAAKQPAPVRRSSWRKFFAKLREYAKDSGQPTTTGPVPRPDLRLIPAVTVVWLGAALAIGLPWRFSAAGVCGCLLLGLGLGIVLRRRYIRLGTVQAADREGIAAIGAVTAALLAAICLGTLLFAVGLVQYDREHAPLAQAVSRGEEFSLTLRVLSSPREIASTYGAPLVTFDAVVLSATARGQRFVGPLPLQVIAGPAWAQVKEGATASTAGRIAPGPLNERSAGILRPATKPLGMVAPSGSGIHSLRAAWVEAVQKTWKRVSPDTAALLPGMVMGDRSAVKPALSEAMKIVGLTHLTAVSGANCTLVLASLMLILRTVHLPPVPTVAVAVAGLAGFVAVVGPDPSVLRAAVMGTIGCLAMLSGRVKRVGALLSVSIVVLLILDPWLAVNYAFILSVLATLGLHLIGQRCANRLGVWMPQWAAQALAIPLAAQLFCAPVIVLLSPRLTPYTVPANMVVAPVVALVTVVGTFGMVMAPLLPGLAQLCAGISGTGAWWVAYVAKGMARLPAATVPWPMGIKGAVLMALMNVVFIAALCGLVERQRLGMLFKIARARLPPRWRSLLSFHVLTVCAALGAGLWTVAVLAA